MLAGVFGKTMAIANERWFGTLPALLATPANRAALFAGRFLPQIVNGLLVSLGKQGPGVYLIEAATRDVSSTQIRAALAAGGSIARLVPENVERHIIRHGLYGAVDRLHGDTQVS